MKARVIITTLVLWFFGAALCFAESAYMGTWKLNKAKSEFGPKAPRNNIVVYESGVDDVTVTEDGTDSDGNPTHHEWTGMFDGKDYPVTGDPNSDLRSYTKIDDRTLGLNFKRGGRRTASGRIEVSADGRRHTVTTRGIDSKGKKVMSIAVYDKQ